MVPLTYPASVLNAKAARFTCSRLSLKYSILSISVSSSPVNNIMMSLSGTNPSVFRRINVVIKAAAPPLLSLVPLPYKKPSFSTI